MSELVMEVFRGFLVLFQTVGRGSSSSCCINRLLFFSVNLKKNQDDQQGYPLKEGLGILFSPVAH